MLSLKKNKEKNKTNTKKTREAITLYTDSNTIKPFYAFVFDIFLYYTTQLKFHYRAGNKVYKVSTRALVDTGCGVIFDFRLRSHAHTVCLFIKSRCHITDVTVFDQKISKLHIVLILWRRAGKLSL